MPKLSQTLSGPISPDLCQGCGKAHDLSRWREHDESDRPTSTVIVLCLWCEQSLIERHPRLYAQLGDHDPDPGSMAICLACIHRAGLRCTHSAAKVNGGSGVRLTIARAERYHVSYTTKGGRRAGECFTRWPAPATDCEQREATVFPIPAGYLPPSEWNDRS